MLNSDSVPQRSSAARVGSIPSAVVDLAAASRQVTPFFPARLVSERRFLESGHRAPLRNTSARSASLTFEPLEPVEGAATNETSIQSQTPPAFVRASMRAVPETVDVITHSRLKADDCSRSRGNSKQFRNHLKLCCRIGRILQISVKSDHDGGASDGDWLRRDSLSARDPMEVRHFLNLLRYFTSMRAAAIVSWFRWEPSK